MKRLARLSKTVVGAGFILLLAGSAVAQTTSSATSKTAPPKAHTTSHKGKKSKKTRARGQKKIDPTRAREIQEALIRQHYMSGKASGIWDDSTQKAMERYQADNGWQSKTTPDSRALIKLGLGPDQAHLLNPDSAMTMSNQSPAHAPSGTVPPVPGDPAPDPPQK